MWVARPLGRGNHLEHTEHWCIFDFFWVPDFVRSVAGDCSGIERGDDSVELEGLELLLSPVDVAAEPRPSSLEMWEDW